MEKESNLTKALRLMLAKSGISQAELARRINAERQLVNNTLRDETETITEQTLNRLLAGMDCSIKLVDIDEHSCMLYLSVNKSAKSKQNT